MPSSNSIYNYVPDGTQLNYNGYEFPQYRKLDWQSQPVYDEADRARTGVKYTLAVHFLITSPDQATSAATIDSIRCKLTRPGAILIVKGLGFGDMTVGGSRATETVLDWGPKPRMLHFESISGVLSYEAIWTCEFTIADCCGGVSAFLSTQPISAWNASSTYSIDDRGLTVRTVSGYFEIPSGSRASATSPTVAITADQYRDRVAVNTPFGFKRVRSDWRLSADQRRVEFGIVDQELEGDDFLPPGIVRGSFEKSLSNNKARNFFEWTYTINATFERAAGTSLDWGYQKLFLIVATSLQQIQQAILTPDLGASGDPFTGNVLPEKISLSTDAYTRTMRMSVVIGIVRSTYDIISISGIWAPLANDGSAAYVAWKNSMAKLWSNRGNAQLFHDPTTDAILDPCVGGAMTVNDTQGTYQKGSNYQSIMGCGNITPSTSWIRYECWTEVRKDNGVAIHNPMQTYQAPADQPTDFSTDETSAGSYAQTKYQPIVQQRKAPATEVALVGMAARVKFRPTIPTLLTFGGVPRVELRRYVTGPRILGSMAGCDTYGVSWRIEYGLNGVPANNTPILDQPRPNQKPQPGGNG